MSKKNSLYLIPTPISKRKQNVSLPDYTLDIVKELTCFLVEKPQTAFSFLQWIQHPVPDYKMTVRVLNKKTPDEEIFSFLKFLKNQDVGLMSEAGAPGVADPGAKFVHLAHKNNYKVIPLVGPSSILLALMASGLNGQKFAFHGYLPINENKRKQQISVLERESKKQNQTQICMETPHRNSALMSDLLSTLSPSTPLCVACNLTAKDEFVQTLTVHQWKSSGIPDIQKKPALFLFLA